MNILYHNSCRYQIKCYATLDWSGYFLLLLSLTSLRDAQTHHLFFSKLGWVKCYCSNHYLTLFRESYKPTSLDLPQSFLYVSGHERVRLSATINLTNYILQSFNRISLSYPVLPNILNRSKERDALCDGMCTVYTVYSISKTFYLSHVKYNMLMYFMCTKLLDL